MVDNPRGFIEYRNLSGRVSPITRLRRIKADGRSGTFRKFAGDPVVLVSGDTVGRVSGAAADGLPILGVIRDVLNAQGRPLTFSLPDGNFFIEASTAGFCNVNEDPDQTYLVNCDATLTSNEIGLFVSTTADAPTTAAGRSGISIAIDTATVTAAATEPFQIIGAGIDALNRPNSFGGSGNVQDAEVRIARHLWGNILNPDGTTT